MAYTLRFLAAIALLAVGAKAHPGSGIVVDEQGQVFFVDTGQGVWKIDADGRLGLFHKLAYHWMALDEKGFFARQGVLGEFDRGSFERITPAGVIPTLILSSDYPIAVAEDGALHYVPYNRGGRREMIRRTADGKREVLAALPTDAGDKAILWVNGVSTGPGGSLYATDNDTIRKIEKNGAVTTVLSRLELPDCPSDPPPGLPKGPHLRGLAVHPDGTVYVAATGCRSLIQIMPKGTIHTLSKAEAPWSPTGVAISGNDIYVLEYSHTPGDDRKEWIPRVRKIDAKGKITTIATVTR